MWQVGVYKQRQDAMKTAIEKLAAEKEELKQSIGAMGLSHAQVRSPTTPLTTSKRHVS